MAGRGYRQLRGAARKERDLKVRKAYLDGAGVRALMRRFDLSESEIYRACRGLKRPKV